MAATLIKKRQLEALAIVDADVSAISDSKITNIGNYIKKDGTVAHAADQSMGNFKITNLGAPVAATDAARLQDVQNAALGLSAKDAVRVATIAQITLSGVQTIDGIVLVAGERVLVKAQTLPAENGIYVVNASTWTRSTDANTSALLSSAIFCFVEEGTTNADSGWLLATDGAVTLGTTALNFVQFSGAGQVVSGAGMTKNGNTMDVGTASTARIVVNADNIDLATTAVTPGTYGNTGANVTQITVDAYGRITNATNRALAAGDISAQVASAILASITALATNGLIARTAAGVVTARSIAGTAGRVGVTNGDAVAGNPTIDLLVSGATAGTFNKVTVDIYGRITSATLETYIDATHLVVRETPTGLVNGSNPTFTIANTPITGKEEVYLNGILQDPGAGNDYTIAGATITMLTTPLTGEKIRVNYIY